MDLRRWRIEKFLKKLLLAYGSDIISRREEDQVSRFRHTRLCGALKSGITENIYLIV